MGSWRKRKKEVEARTAEVNKQYGMDGLIDNDMVVGVSGKLDERYHYRTLRDGSVRVCKNPKQKVHGESLKNAHLMKEVMRVASEEYHDAAKRSEWEERYAEAVEKGVTEVKGLWQWIVSEVRKRMMAEKL